MTAGAAGVASGSASAFSEWSEGEVAHPCVERYGGGESEHECCLGWVGEDVADVAEPVAANDPWGGCAVGSKCFGHVEHGAWGAGAHVERPRARVEDWSVQARWLWRHR